MFRKILVSYDGSEPADMALDQAVNIAKAFGKDRSEVIPPGPPSSSLKL